jgi:2-keto-4-pentenoate hydratase/2-oxohepta-3-ene-1,7-dioic acid hydratase in catechol pathway
MKFANIDGRAALVRDGRCIDVSECSEGRFGPDPQEAYERWDELKSWADSCSFHDAAPFSPERIGPPAPRPRQVIAVGLNYREHARESGFGAPEGLPPVFTKFPSALTGPFSEIGRPAGNVDWEVELAVVIGAPAREVDARGAWSHVAGLTVAQDFSERVRQLAGESPQYSLGKSHRGFAPMGPYVVTPDEFEDPSRLGISCSVNGETVQDGSTGDMIFPVPMLIERLSRVITLFPGDVILTGTPSGVGVAREPQRFIQPGDVVVSSIEGIGSMENRFFALS